MSGAVVLVTGSAGAVGRPLVEELLRRDGIARVIALKHREGVGSRDRVEAVRGDVTAHSLGLTGADAERLRADITAIVHAAADTRFLPQRDDEAIALQSRTNVEGTRNVLAFAAGCPRLDRFVALSTTHVAGRRSGCILEDDLEHAAGFVNAYEASKHRGERVLREAMQTLPVSVCRLSTVVGHSVTGSIARPAAIHHAVRLMYAGLAPMIPGREDSPVDVLASDYVARAVAVLATTAFEPGRTWHLCAGSDTMAAGDLLDLTMQSFIEYRPAWRKRTIARPALVDLGTFELFCRSAEQAGSAPLAAAASMMAAFAPQLAFPKRFDDRQCRAALQPHDVARPSIRETWRRVVRTLVEPQA